MAIGLLILLALEGVRVSIRKYHKRQAKKFQYDGEFRKDYLGRPLDNNGKRMTRNEARAKAAHKRESLIDSKALHEWKSKGNQLPDYTSATTTTSDKAASSEQSMREGQAPNWQEWVVAGAPRYEERQIQTGETSLVRA